MKNFRKRWTAWVLMFSLIISAVPVNAFAYDGGAVDDQVIEIAQGGFYDLTQDLEAGLEGVWESDNEEIVVVNENGVAEGKAVGETTVRFTAEKINLGPAPEMKDEAVNVPANSDAAAPGPDAGVIAPGEEDSQLNQEPGSIDTPVVDENNSEKTDSELTGTEGTGSEVNGGEDGNTTDTPATDETGSNNEAVENDGANGGEPAVGDEGTDEGGTSDEGSGTDESNTSDEGGSEAAGSDEGDTSNEPSAEGTDGAYLTEETDDTVVYTWTVRVYDPAVRDFANAVDAISAELDGLELNAEFSAATYKAQVDALLGSLTEEQQASEEAQAAVDHFVDAAVGVLARAWKGFNEAMAALEGAEEVTEEETASLETLQLLLDSYSMELMGLFGEDMVTAKLEAIMQDKNTLAETNSVTFTGDSNFKWKNNEVNSFNKSGTLTVTGNVTGQIVVEKGTLKINGTGTINGNSKGSVVTVKSGAAVELNGVTIKGGSGTQFDPSDDTVTMATAKCGGGVFVNTGGKFTMNSGTITKNTADTGGGIYIARNADGTKYGELYIYGGSIIDNTASKHEGGGIWFTGKKGEINPINSDIVIRNNKTQTTTDLGGGGLFVESKGKMNIVNAVITGNTAQGLGGGVAGCLHGMITNLSPDTAAIYSNTAIGRAKLPKEGSNGSWGWNLVDHDLPRLPWTKDFNTVGADYFCAGYSVIGSTALNDGKASWSGKAVYRPGGINDPGSKAEKGGNYPSGSDGYGNNMVSNAKNANVSTGKTDPIEVQGLVALHVTNPDKVKAAVDNFKGKKVYIDGNTSAMHGAGVGCNGILTFGQETEEFVYSNTKITLNASKAVEDILNANTSKQGYIFKLCKDEAGSEVIATAVSNNNGNIVFADIASSSLFGTGTKAGNKSVTVYLLEMPGDKAGMKYDTNARKIVLRAERTVVNKSVETQGQGNTIKRYELSDKLLQSYTNDKGTTVSTTVAVKNVQGSYQIVSGGITVAKNGKSATLKDDANFKNIMEYGNLVVKKTVEGNTLDNENSFAFEVTLGNGNATGTVSNGVGNYVANGKYTFNLQKDGTATIRNIPVGVKYTVTETGLDESKFTKSGEVTTPTEIVKDTNNNVTVKNTRQNTNLTVKKEVTYNSAISEPAPADKTFDIKVKIGSKDNPVAVGEGSSYNGEGVYTFTLKAGESATICGVPTGAPYKVTEPDYKQDSFNEDGFKLQSITSSDVNDGNAEKGQTVTVANNYFKSILTDITVNKVFAGDGKLLPSKIEVQLLRDDAVFKTQTLTRVKNSTDGTGNTWTYTWENLEKYKSDGTEYKYTIKETAISYASGTSAGYDVDERQEGSNLVRVRNPKKVVDTTGEKEILGGWIIADGVMVTYDDSDKGSATITNTWRPATQIGTATFEVRKVDAEDSSINIDGVTFTLTKIKAADGTAIEKSEPIALVTQNGGIAKFEGLEAGTYNLEETGTPLAYDLPVNNQKWEIVVSKTDKLISVKEIDDNDATVGENEWYWDASVDDNTNSMTVTNQIIKGNLSITKNVELDGKVVNNVLDQKFSFNVYKLEDGKLGKQFDETKEVAAGYAASFNNLPYGDYLIEEVEPAETVGKYHFTGLGFKGPGKEMTIDGKTYWHVKVDAQDTTYVVSATNSYTRDTGSFSLTKVVQGIGDKEALWNFTIELTAPETYVDLAKAFKLEITGDNVSDTTAPDSIRFTKEEGKERTYTGKISLKHGQTATISGLPVGTNFKVTEDNEQNVANWTYYSKDAADNTGKIDLGIVPLAKFTNSLEEKTIPTWANLAVKKVWENEEGYGNVRPASIDVQLLQDGEIIETVTLNEANNWAYTWKHMDIKHYKWEVKEVNVPEGYRLLGITERDSQQGTTTIREITITNAYINPGQFVVTKEWALDNPANRPESISVQLYNGIEKWGEPVVITPDENGKWDYTWEELPLNGNWNVQEIELPEDSYYEPSVVYSPDGKSATITNTYHQPLTVNKVWVGGNEANRPSAITVQLYNGTTPYGDAVQLTAEGGWTHTWTMLPLDGNWRVVETTVPDGYHANVAEVINGVIVVTNTYDDNNGGGDEPGGDEPETNIPNEPTPLTDLPDDDVPLATLPSADGEGENDDEEIFDEKIPLADVPTTGDDGKSGLWLALAMSSGLAGIWLHQNGRKRREETQD